MPNSYYVFVTRAGDGYHCGQIGTPETANSIPISTPYPSIALAHDNMMHRTHMPLNERQRNEIERLQAVYSNGSAKNQEFFEQLLRHNRWAAGEIRPTQACLKAVLGVITLPAIEPPLELERAVGVGGSAPRHSRLQEGVPTLKERGGRAKRPKEREGVRHDRT